MSNVVLFNKGPNVISAWEITPDKAGWQKSKPFTVEVGASAEFDCSNGKRVDFEVYVKEPRRKLSRRKYDVNYSDEEIKS